MTIRIEKFLTYSANLNKSTDIGIISRDLGQWDLSLRAGGSF